MKGASRERRGLPGVETVVQDVRYGVRALLRTPGFTLAALLTLALGIGANTAIFSVVNAVLLRPLDYPEPDRIVELMRRHPDGTEQGQTGRRYLFFRENVKAVQALAAWRDPSGFNVATGDGAEFVKAMSVSKEFFDVFGVRPMLGAPFTSEQDVTGGPDVAFCRTACGGDFSPPTPAYRHADHARRTSPHHRRRDAARLRRHAPRRSLHSASAEHDRTRRRLQLRSGGPSGSGRDNCSGGG